MLASTDVTKSSKTDSEMKIVLGASVQVLGKSGRMNIEMAMSDAQAKLGNTVKITKKSYEGDPALLLSGDMNGWLLSTLVSHQIVGYQLCHIFELLPHGLESRRLLEEATREWIEERTPYHRIIDTLNKNKVVYMANHGSKETIRALGIEGRDYTANEACAAQGWINTWYAFLDIQRNNNWKNAADSYRFDDLLRNFEGKSLEEFQNEIDEKKRRGST